jgi:sugar O-acyltransferase (sialic acid O-acetyltransferase NeuD family)
MKILVYGSKDFGQLVRELVIHCGHEFLGFVDDVGPKAPGVVGAYPEVVRRYPPGDGIGMAIAIGYNHLEARHAAWVRARKDGYQTPVLAHRSAMVASGAKVGEGSILMAGANVDVFTELGEICVLWPGAIVSHDCKVGANCFLSPGAIVCGFVTIGTSCFLGAGSVIVDHRNLPSGAFVKAGAVHK